MNGITYEHGYLSRGESIMNGQFLPHLPPQFTLLGKGCENSSNCIHLERLYAYFLFIGQKKQTPFLPVCPPPLPTIPPSIPIFKLSRHFVYRLITQ